MVDSLMTMNIVSNRPTVAWRMSALARALRELDQVRSCLDLAFSIHKSQYTDMYRICG